MPSNIVGFLYTLPDEVFRHAVCPGETVTVAQTGALEHRSGQYARGGTSSADGVDSDSAVGTTCLTCGIGGRALSPTRPLEYFMMSKHCFAPE